MKRGSRPNKNEGEPPESKRVKGEKASKTTQPNNTQPSSRRNNEDHDPCSKSKGIFSEQRILVLPTGIGKARTDLFRKQITANGGIFHDKFCSDTTFIVVDENMEVDRMCRILQIDKPPDEVTVVKSLWLSTCLREKQLVDLDKFKLTINRIQLTENEYKKETEVFQGKESQNIPSTSELNEDQAIAQTSKPQKYFKKPVNVTGSDIESDYEPSGDEDGNNALELDIPQTSKRPMPKGNWACAQASSQKQVNHNKDITDKLEALAQIYENTNDRWRALGYQKGIAALKRHPKKITTFEEAKALPGVGERLASKIWEIIESGELRKLDEISSTEEVQAINVFTKIWGAGAATARQWVSLGYRTLDDIRTKAKLTRHQQIGLMYYDDLNERMLREEAGRIADTVTSEAFKLDPGLICMACGSYRRGKETCGDVDVLITHPDGRSHAGIFNKIINQLHSTGFLTDDLVTNEENGLQKKYMGVCKLLGPDTKHRRLDIIVVPYDEYACAVMYFTGSAHFNRSMRHLAGKMGMSLSEHSLNIGVVRSKGEKLTKGTPLPTPTEESVFKHLGLPYRPPDQRNH